jgi:IS30 family transposase
MRLWSISPFYRDNKGLTACWREGLLALAILQGKTKGYTHHPQLERFRATHDPAHTVSNYLHYICDEADSRHYHFDRLKLLPLQNVGLLTVTDQQVRYEWKLLSYKIYQRTGISALPLIDQANIDDLQKVVHPLFKVIPGPIESWEKVKVIPA